MRGVFDDLVFLMGTGVLGDQALFVIYSIFRTFLQVGLGILGFTFRGMIAGTP
jgi:hypothetical protein